MFRAINLGSSESTNWRASSDVGKGFLAAQETSKAQAHSGRSAA
jgi:hypothetical protein